METQIARVFKPGNQGYFLFGPRGTGKTTFLKQKYPDAIYYNLLDYELFRQFSSKPERLADVLREVKERTVIIDEIQKIPQLLQVIHMIIEEKRGICFILTGSSARKLKKSGADLLAARVLKYSFHPFMACELGERFNLDEALEFGLLPVIYSSPEKATAIKTYASMYVKEEVLDEGLVRNIGNFSRFLEIVSFSHGSILNVSNVARDCQVERKTVEGYIAILEDLLIAYRVPVFTKKAKRILIKHPKFYLFDIGLFNGLRPLGPIDNPGSIGGSALEGLVFQHLTAWNSYRGDNNKISYFITKSGLEVDFVIYGKETFYAVEVKNTSNVKDSDLRALKAFSQDYPEAKPVFLYRGKYRLKKSNITCIPVEEFLKGLDPSKAGII